MAEMQINPDVMDERLRKLEDSCKSCLAGFTSEGRMRAANPDEVKTAVEAAAHELIEAVRDLEKYFLRLYFQFASYYPEELLKEETSEMLTEIRRKKELIANQREKIAAWQQTLKSYDQNQDSRSI